MKIVFLTRLYHPHIGGVEKHVEKLGQVLVREGHQVVVITEQYESSLNLEDTINGIKILRIPRQNTLSKFGIWGWFAKYKPFLDTSDVVHAHDVFWWLFMVRPWLKIPVYTTFHGWEGVFPPQTKAKLVRKISEKLSKGTICVGDFIAKWYGTKPNVVTYGATDQLPLEPGSKDRIIVFGRLSQDNDIPMVIQGLRLVKQKFPHLKVTFLGDGELAWEAEKLGKVLGFQENPERFLKKAHWIVASSYLAILDSLAAGRQVVSVYSNPLKKDYITTHPRADLLIKAGTPDAFVQEFTNAYLKGNNVSQNSGQAWAVEQTWEKLAVLYKELWDKDYKVAFKDFQENN